MTKRRAGPPEKASLNQGTVIVGLGPSASQNNHLLILILLKETCGRRTGVGRETQKPLVDLHFRVPFPLHILAHTAREKTICKKTSYSTELFLLRQKPLILQGTRKLVKSHLRWFSKLIILSEPPSQFQRVKSLKTALGALSSPTPAVGYDYDPCASGWGANN